MLLLEAVRLVEFLDVDDVVLGVDAVAVLVEGDLARQPLLQHLLQDVPAGGGGRR